MVEVHKYKESYYNTLIMMLESQQYPQLTYITQDSLPEIGFIASDSATHIAMGFLRMVEGGYAQIDGLVSNASLSSELRHFGISLVVEKLMQTAKEMNLKGIISYTSDESVIKRANRLGFSSIPQTILLHTLGD